MPETNYWSDRFERRLSRRRLLGASAVSAAGMAGATLLACGGPKKPGQASTSGSQSPASASGGAKDTPRPGGTLNVYLPQSYSLDPHRLSGAGQQLTGAAMSRVFRYKTSADPRTIADHALEPDLGISAESADAVTWTVKLRSDARFQNIPPVNGHAVEAEDVRASFTRALDPATINPNRGALGMIDANQIQTPDKQTVVFKLKYPYAPFKGILGSPAYSWIFPREVLSGGYDPAKTLIGSGPFLLDNAQPDVAYTFKRNPDWFGNPGPYVDGLRVAVIPSAAQQLAQFTAGNLDHLELRLPFDLATAKQNAPRAAVSRVVSGPANPLYFQLGDPTSVFQDIRVRRAVSMAIDRDAISQVVYGGEGVEYVFVSGFLGKWSLPVDKLDPAAGQYYKYNPGEAKKLLEAAGQTSLQIRLTNPLASQGQIDTAKAVEAINGMLNAIGIKSTIVNLDFNKDYIGTGRGIRAGYYDKDMVICSSNSPYTEVDDFLFGYLHSKTSQNIEHLSDPAYDAMVDKQRTLVNEDERLKAVQDIQKYIAEKMYAVSTVGSYRWELVQPRVRNYSYSDSQGLYTENYAKVWLDGQAGMRSISKAPIAQASGRKIATSTGSQPIKGECSYEKEYFMDFERASLASLVAPQHTAVLVVDVQPMFTAMPLSPPLAEVLPRLRRFIDAARTAGVPHIFIRHIIPADRWTEVWQHPGFDSALAPESPLIAFAPGFEPEADDLTVVKQRYSGFVGTELEALLRERGIRTVVLVGLTTDICVSSTARDAFHHEIHTVTLSDCTAEQTLARHEAGLASLAACFGRVCTSAEILAAWQVEVALAEAQV